MNSSNPEAKDSKVATNLAKAILFNFKQMVAANEISDIPDRLPDDIDRWILILSSDTFLIRKLAYPIFDVQMVNMSNTISGANIIRATADDSQFLMGDSLISTFIQCFGLISKDMNYLCARESLKWASCSHVLIFFTNY